MARLDCKAEPNTDHTYHNTLVHLLLWDLMMWCLFIRRWREVVIVGWREVVIAGWREVVIVGWRWVGVKVVIAGWREVGCKVRWRWRWR